MPRSSIDKIAPNSLGLQKRQIQISGDAATFDAVRKLDTRRDHVRVLLQPSSDLSAGVLLLTLPRI